MERYLQQLLADIRWAREHIPEPWWHFIDSNDDEEDEEPFLLRREEPANAPQKSLEELTGLRQFHLPPADRLDSRQVQLLLQALKDLLSAYNCHVIFQQSGIPHRLQYEVIRRRFKQGVPQLRTTDHFFSFCDPGQERSSCSLGSYCECNFLDNLLSRYDEAQEEEGEERGFHDLSLRRKDGRDWEKYHQYYDWDNYEEDFPEDEDIDWWDDEEEEW